MDGLGGGGGLKKKWEKMIWLTPSVAVLAERAAVKPSYPTETTR